MSYRHLWLQSRKSARATCTAIKKGLIELGALVYARRRSERPSQRQAILRTPTTRLLSFADDRLGSGNSMVLSQTEVRTPPDLFDVAN